MLITFSLQFLKGTSLDPSLYFGGGGGGGSSTDLLRQPNITNNPEIICIDDDEDEDQPMAVIPNDNARINQSYLQGMPNTHTNLL